MKREKSVNLVLVLIITAICCLCSCSPSQQSMDGMYRCTSVTTIDADGSYYPSNSLEIGATLEVDGTIAILKDVSQTDIKSLVIDYDNHTMGPRDSYKISYKFDGNRIILTRPLGSQTEEIVFER